MAHRIQRRQRRASPRTRPPSGHSSMRNLLAIHPAVARNFERSAGETAQATRNCGDIVTLIGSEPTKRDQRLDCAALDVEHEADFARRARRRGYTQLDPSLDELDQRTCEGILVDATGWGPGAAYFERQNNSIGFGPHTEGACGLPLRVRHSHVYWPVLIALATGMRRGEVLALR